MTDHSLMERMTTAAYLASCTVGQIKRTLDHLYAGKVRVKILRGKYKGRTATIREIVIDHGHEPWYMLTIRSSKNPEEVLSDHADARRGYRATEFEEA